LRAIGQDYDASLARARASRLSYGGRFEHCFPAIDPAASEATMQGKLDGEKITERENGSRWARFQSGRSQLMSARFFLYRNAGLLTNIIIAINIALYLLVQANPLFYIAMAQFNPAIQTGQFWRLITGIFVYPPGDMNTSLLPFLISMLSLFFIGRSGEIFYGQGRYAALYAITAIGSAVACYLLYITGIAPVDGGLGPNGAIFGIFSAFGMFYIVNRRAFGPAGTSAMMNWAFWLIINLALAHSTQAVIIELTSLAVSLIIAFLLVPRLRRV
jgi:membrane associated rhomboid family serine protease